MMERVLLPGLRQMQVRGHTGARRKCLCGRAAGARQALKPLQCFNAHFSIVLQSTSDPSSPAMTVVAVGCGVPHIQALPGF